MKFNLYACVLSAAGFLVGHHSVVVRLFTSLHCINTPLPCRNMDIACVILVSPLL